MNGFLTKNIIKENQNHKTIIQSFTLVTKVGTRYIVAKSAENY